jgi:hypothetical protein
VTRELFEAAGVVGRFRQGSRGTPGNAIQGDNRHIELAGSGLLGLFPAGPQPAKTRNAFGNFCVTLAAHHRFHRANLCCFFRDLEDGHELVAIEVDLGDVCLDHRFALA